MVATVLKQDPNTQKIDLLSADCIVMNIKLVYLSGFCVFGSDFFSSK